MKNPSYQRTEPFVITDEIRREITGALAEIDLAQMAIVSKMTPAERVSMALSMIEAAEDAGVVQLRRRQPELSEAEAYRIVRGGLIAYYRDRQP